MNRRHRTAAQASRLIGYQSLEAVLLGQGRRTRSTESQDMAV